MMITILGTTASFAGSQKGQKYYMKTFKAKFGNMNGAKFASMYTIDEWEELFAQEGEAFIEEFSERFPKATKVLNGKKAWKKLQHIRDFAIKYASDSGNIVSCG